MLTQMELPQMYGMNSSHDDPEASSVQVTVYSNGRFSVVYKMMFDRWAIKRNAIPAEILKGRFKYDSYHGV